MTVQNSVGVSGFYELPPAAVGEQIDAVLGDLTAVAAGPSSIDRLQRWSWVREGPCG